MDMKKLTSPYEITRIDPWLEPYSGEIDLRMNRFKERRAQVAGDRSTLTDFADGYLYFAGRIKELIKRGGESIIPNEVASAVSENDMIADVRVFGIPDEFWGETVAAAVITKDNEPLDENRLRRHLRTRLAKFKIPEYFICFEAFPTLPNGKIDAVNLKKEIEERVKILRESKGQ